MSDYFIEHRRHIDAFLHATTMLEQLIDDCQVQALDGLKHIEYGRPKVGVRHEIVVGNQDPAYVLAVTAAHAEVLPAYLSTFAPLGNDEPTGYEHNGVPRVVRNTLMTLQLTGDGQPAERQLTRLTDASELRELSISRGDSMLDVDYFTDDILCLVLDVEGEPISSALLIPSIDRFAVIEHVHTLTAHWRRGYGRRLLKALHDEAIYLDAERIVLGSNDAGRLLYDSLGYQPICHQDVYVPGL